MAWIESHQELRHHYKTKRLARELNVTVAAAVGHLHFLWWWAIDFAPDGDLTKFDDYEIADAIGYEGEEPFKAKAALISAGFLDSKSDGTITIHDWYEYAGRTLLKRKEIKAANRERQKRYRDRKKTRDSAEDDESITKDECVSNALRVTSRNAHVTPCNVPTLHNITEHNITEQTPPLPPASGGRGDGVKPDAQESRFNDFWRLYPKKQGKGAALKVWKRLKPDKALFEQIIASVKTNIDRNEQWKRENGRFIPNPTTWLKEGRWEDEITAGTGRNAVRTAADYAGGERPSFAELAQELAQELTDETEVPIT